MFPRLAVPALLDTALDRAVVPGNSRLGYQIRRLGWAQGDPHPVRLKR